MILIHVLMITLFFIMLSVFILRIIQVKKCNLSTEGEIVDIKEEITISHNNKLHTSHKIYTYFPVFKFYVNGKEYIKKSSTGSSNPPYNIGDKVKVVYFEENPNDALISDYTSQNIITSIIGILVIIGFAIYMIIQIINLNK